MKKYRPAGNERDSYLDTDCKKIEDKITVANERLQYLLSSTKAIIYSSKASGDFGARKPDPEIFIYALRSMWIKADETVHVGDSLNEDVQGAKKAGMKTVWIKGNKEMTELQPDYVISKITELPNLF